MSSMETVTAMSLETPAEMLETDFVFCNVEETPCRFFTMLWIRSASSSLLA